MLNCIFFFNTRSLNFFFQRLRWNYNKILHISEFCGSDIRWIVKQQDMLAGENWTKKFKSPISRTPLMTAKHMAGKDVFFCSRQINYPGRSFVNLSKREINSSVEFYSELFLSKYCNYTFVLNDWSISCRIGCWNMICLSRLTDFKRISILAHSRRFICKRELIALRGGQSSVHSPWLSG